MDKQSKWVSLLIVVVLMMLSLTPVSGEWMEQVHGAPPAQAVESPATLTQETPEPLPEDCDDITPLGPDPVACCLYGYTYDGDVPLRSEAGDTAVELQTVGNKDCL